MTERPSSTQQYLRSIVANVVDVDRDEQLVRIEGALPPVGTHVATTAEVGPVRISKVESKSTGFRRIRVDLEADPAAAAPEG
jgi:Ser-tRNA(Ala) deacylase AlaX